MNLTATIKQKPIIGSDRSDVDDDDDEEKRAGHAAVILHLGTKYLAWRDPPFPRLNCLLSRSRIRKWDFDIRCSTWGAIPRNQDIVPMIEQRVV